MAGYYEETDGSLRFTRMDGDDSGSQGAVTCTATAPLGSLTTPGGELMGPQRTDFLSGGALAVTLADGARLEVPRAPGDRGDWEMTIELAYGGEGVARSGEVAAVGVAEEETSSATSSVRPATSLGEWVLRRMPRSRFASGQLRARTRAAGI